MSHSLVTVVIATYNRPDTLAVAIKSVLYQTITSWKMLVIGDNCDDRTAKAVRDFDDNRISYINLPKRFGEQAGPNSVGMALAQTPYIALLNHDDVFLPDHLEISLKMLERSGGDIFIGCASTTWKSIDDSKWVKKPVFKIVSSQKRLPRNIFDSHFQVFEPTSAWVFKNTLARRVGPWLPATDLYRAPLQDWLLRTWRKRANFIFGKKTTVLALRTHYQNVSTEGNYKFESKEHLYIDEMIRNNSGEEIRTHLEKELPPGGGTRKWGKMFKTRKRFAKLFYWPLTNRFTAYFYYLTGIDTYSRFIYLAGAKKNVLSRAIIARTGSALPPVEDYQGTLDTAIQYAKEELWRPDDQKRPTS